MLSGRIWSGPATCFANDQKDAFSFGDKVAGLKKWGQKYGTLEPEVAL